MTDESSLIDEQIAADEVRYGPLAELIVLRQSLANGICRVNRYIKAKMFADEAARIAEPIDADAIGLAVAERLSEEAMWSAEWKQHIAAIVADEFRKAEATKAEAKEGESDASNCTEAPTSPVVRTEVGGRIEEDVKSIARAVADGDVEDATSAFAHMCGWAETEEDSHADSAGRIEDSVMRKAAILSGGGCPHCQRERLQDESRPSPLSSLSESEYGGMVGAVDLFLLEGGDATIHTLARIAQVSVDQIFAYVTRADHLCLDHCDVVRRVSGGSG